MTWQIEEAAPTQWVIEDAPAPTSTRDKFDLRGEGFDKLKNYSPVDTIGGLVRGSGSIGATAMGPFDYLEDKLTTLMGGQNSPVSRNQHRRSEMDYALQNMGVDTNSTQFKANKLAGEVAGTAGIGGAAANVLSRIPGAATQIPNLLNAIRTGGMTTGAPAGASRVADMGVRVAGGAVNGGLTAGAVNPQEADTGMMIGGAFPMVTKAIGATGDAIGGLFKGAPAANPTKLQTAKESMEAGYVIPPSMIEPSLRNRILESTSGKHATAQIAATKNQQVTDDLVRRALKLPPDSPLTQEVMKKVRQDAATAGYSPLKATGTVTADQIYIDALDTIGKTVKSATAAFPKLGPTNMHGQPIDEIGSLVSALKQPKFDAGGAVDTIAVLRDNADSAFVSGNKALGRANKAAATALEDALDRHLQQIGATDLLPAYRDARSLIAKTHTVEKGLREGAGTVDARALARELQKGKPLSGDLRSIAKFANTFDKAAQPPHLIGSPGVHNLTSMYSTGAGATGAAAGAFLGGPVGAGVGATLGAAYPFVVPPIARSLMFSKGAQQGLLNQGGGQSLLGNGMDELLPLMYRSSGLLAGRSGQ
jgi:hypothetical protein